MPLPLKSAIAVLILIAIGSGGYVINRHSTNSEKKPLAQPAVAVRTGYAVQKPVPITLLANGYVSAIETVDVRSQVQHIVREVHVREGQDVHAGQLLFSLDQQNDLSGVDKAQAQIARDRADFSDAETTLKRNQELLAKKFIAQAVVDSARSKVAALRSTLQGDQAAARASRAVLDYNQIKASISGRIGTINVHPGSLAQPAGPPLVTISQLDPIAVSFTLPERELAHLRATYPQGDAPVRAQIEGASTVEGKLIFIDNTADPQSGTIRMKARFANPDRRMWPGTFVLVRMVSRILPDAVVVPAQAIVTGPVEKFVYVVGADQKVTMHKIDVVTIEDGEAAVAGIAAGARVVVEGSENLRAGLSIKEMRPLAAATGAPTPTASRAP